MRSVPTSPLGPLPLPPSLRPWCAGLVLLLGPLVSFWMVELLNGNDLFTSFQLWQIAMNLIWYFWILLLCWLLFRRMRWAAITTASLSLAIGLVNHYVLRFRGRILFPGDLSAWQTAANVAKAFDFSLDLPMIQAIGILLLYVICVFLFLPSTGPISLSRPLWITLFSLEVGYCFLFFQTNFLPSMGIYTQQWVTQQHGFLLNFTTALRYSAIQRPSGYQRQAVLDLLDHYPGLPPDPSITQPVNLLVVMNESFADFSVFPNFQATPDPMPFLHALSENTIKGLMYTPVTGGGTASVEFEYLTGFSTLFQPPHTVAYQLYTWDGMPSLVHQTQTMGYHTTAFHPYQSSGWNRPMVYHQMGFDQQLYQEDVPSPQYVRNYISDASGYQMIQEITAPGAPTFLFHVTMQNHSGYTQGWKNLPKLIQLSPKLKVADTSAEQYFSLLRASDQALQELITHYQQVEEPTMIVFFGDHQPPLKHSFYETLYGKPLPQRTTREILDQYVTPFFLWTNYDIEEEEGVVISPNYLGALTAKLAGLPLTGFQQFLLTLHQKLPAITPVGILDAQGQALLPTQLDPSQQEWLHQYEILNYCGMRDLFEEARPLFFLPPA